MQRIAERVRKAERSVSKKKAKAYEQRLRSEAWSRNQERIRMVKENTAMLRADRKNRAMDWDAGALAPRRDVGDKQKTYGAVSMYSFQLPEKDPKSQLPLEKWPYRKGDRVVITAGRDQGKIGVIEDVDTKVDAVKVKGLNMIDVYLPDWMKEANGETRDVTSVVQYTSRKDVRLVFPLPDPKTGVPRDVIIENLEVVRFSGTSPKRRIIPGTNTIIPWPLNEDSRLEHEDHENDTLRTTVQERTFRPFLIRPPMPLSVIDELRHKYSRFRTRHEYEYMVQKESEDAKVEGRKDLIKTMRTPLQELAALREKQKAAQEKELTREQLAKIGEVIAQEQARTSGGGQVAAA